MAFSASRIIRLGLYGGPRQVYGSFAGKSQGVARVIRDLLISKPQHGTMLVEDGLATRSMQDYLDDIENLINTNLLGNQVQLASYTVASLPVASIQAGVIFVSDETGGAVTAFSDGVNWLRTTDRAVVS